MHCSAVASCVKSKKKRKKRKARKEKEKMEKEKEKPLRARGVVQCVAVLLLGVQRLGAPFLFFFRFFRFFFH